MANTKNKKMAGLGRGLGSILPDAEKDISPVGKAHLTTAITTIALDQIDANPFQPRKDFDDEALKELSQSIKEQGVITPVTVRHMPDGRYQLIAGERRMRASLLAGLKEIPAYIRIATDSQMMEMALVENIQRADLNAMEIAFSYKALIEECQLTHEQLSEKVGKDRSTITNYLRLLNLPSEAQMALSQDKISMAHARCLMGLGKTEDQVQVLHKVMEERLSVRQTEALVKGINAPATPSKRTTVELPTLHAAAQSALKQHLQNEVEIRRTRRGKGTITIHFDNDADFERITSLISPKG